MILLRNNTQWGLIDYETGAEVLAIDAGSEVHVASPAEIEAKRRYKQLQWVARNKPDDVRAKEAVLGPFTWFRCKRGECFDWSGSNADLVRLFILSTYLSYDGILCDDRGILTLKSLTDVLQMSYSPTKDFISSMCANGILEKIGGAYKMDGTLFTRGVLDRRWAGGLGKDTFTARIYHNPLRWIYQRCPPRGTSRIYYILRLIPYLQRDLNYVCRYPGIDGLLPSTPLTAHKAAKEVGVRSANYAKFDAAISHPSLLMPDGQPSIKSIRLAEAHSNDTYLVINPGLIYGGGDMVQAELFCGFTKSGVKPLPLGVGSVNGQNSKEDA